MARLSAATPVPGEATNQVPPPTKKDVRSAGGSAQHGGRGAAAAGARGAGRGAGAGRRHWRRVAGDGAAGAFPPFFVFPFFLKNMFVPCCCVFNVFYSFLGGG